MVIDALSAGLCSTTAYNGSCLGAERYTYLGETVVADNERVYENIIFSSLVLRETLVEDVSATWKTTAKKSGYLAVVSGFPEGDNEIRQRLWRFKVVSFR